MFGHYTFFDFMLNTKRIQVNIVDWAVLGRLCSTSQYRNVGEYFVVADELKHIDVKGNVELSETKK